MVDRIGILNAITFAPNVGYVLDQVVGCGGSLEGLSYRTGAMTQDCIITATSKNTFVGVTGITDPVLAQCIYDTGVKSVEELTVLECDGKGVSSITGLNSFTNLKKLSLQGEARPNTPYYSVGKQTYDMWFATKRLSGYLDFSLLTKLIYLNLNYSYGIEAIDLSKNIELTYLNLGHSAIKFLDVSSLSELTTLFVHNNNLKALAEIRMNDCGVTSLNTMVLPALTDLRIMRCPLATIDFTNNAELNYLDLRGDLLTVVDFTNNTKLLDVNLQDNKLTDILGVECISRKAVTLNLVMNNFNDRTFTYLEKLRLKTGYTNLNY